MKHTAFLGDGEHIFALPFNLIEELEKKTGASFGVLFHRVRTLTFSITDLSETIRLGLIGGGVAPQQAASLVSTYVVNRPIAEFFPIVLAILETAWFGQPAAADDNTGEAANG